MSEKARKETIKNLLTAKEVLKTAHREDWGELNFEHWCSRESTDVETGEGFRYSFPLHGLNEEDKETLKNECGTRLCAMGFIAISPDFPWPEEAENMDGFGLHYFPSLYSVGWGWSKPFIDGNSMWEHIFAMHHEPSWDDLFTRIDEINKKLGDDD